MINVNKRSNDSFILKDINLEIPNSSLFLLVGPPGAGKTMLGRIIAGIEIPDDGRVFFDDRDVTYLSPVERNVAMVFQDFALYPHLTAFENIASPLYRIKLPKVEIIKKVHEIAEYLRISHRLNHYPSELSGGEKQRVAIARALVKRAQTVILDEPFLRLDYKVREEMRLQLHHLQKDVGVNIVLLSSDPMDAMVFPDNVVYMEGGKIVQKGRLDDLYEHPKNISVGKYLGVVEMNEIAGKIIKNNDKFVLDMVIGKIELNSFPHVATKEIRVGIRPEHLLIMSGKVSTTTRDNIIIFKGKVKIAEIIGSETILHLDVELHEPLRVFVPSILKKNPGEVLEVAVRVEDIYFFDLDGKFICRGGDLFG